MFDFLGFTHSCAEFRERSRWLKPITIMHQLASKQGRWTAAVVRGHMAYYAVPGNYEAVTAFCDRVTWHSLRCGTSDLLDQLFHRPDGDHLQGSHHGPFSTSIACQGWVRAEERELPPGTTDSHRRNTAR
jgi:hypothetical protein